MIVEAVSTATGLHWSRIRRYAFSGIYCAVEDLQIEIYASQGAVEMRVIRDGVSIAESPMRKFTILPMEEQWILMLRSLIEGS
jgi:hypothetical protein